MNEATVNYLKGRITNTDFTSSGEVTTAVKVIFDNGFVVTGSSVRDITGFNLEEAQQAAYDNALSSLYPGVDFVLSKV